MRNLFENGVAKTKEEKLFVLNTMLSDFVDGNIIPKFTSDIITNAITSDDVIKYSYVVREDFDEENKIFDFHFAVSDIDDIWDNAYFNLRYMLDAFYHRHNMVEDGEIDRANKMFIKVKDFLQNINLL